MAGSQPASSNGDPSSNPNGHAQAADADTLAGNCNGHADGSTSLGDPDCDCDAYSDRRTDGDSHLDGNTHTDLHGDACSSNGDTAAHADAVANGGGGSGQGCAGNRRSPWSSHRACGC